MTLSRVRPAAVAGMFYPGSPSQLRASVRAMLRAATPRQQPNTAPWPKALIVPHAGYIYSGAIAASAYACLSAGREAIRRVVLLGPVHRVPIRGLALPGAEAFATPLGSVRVDQDAVALLRSLPQVCENDAAHELEHSIEVELPFLQTALEDFTLIPLAVGDATPDEVAEVIDRLWGGRETLIVVSSDLSHYHPYAEACRIDRQTAEKISELAPGLDHEQACGATPINGLALCARRRHLAAELLDLRNSGDTAGDKSRVVGYAAFAFDEARRRAMHELKLGRALVATARAAIGEELGRSCACWPEHDALLAPGASFVTLMRYGGLRGCIGTLRARRPLGLDVRANAVAAAFDDPRFDPLDGDELGQISVEVSLLSAPEGLGEIEEAELIAKLRPGVDGVILQYHDQHATFLPQVWESLRDPKEFLIELKRKAGLPGDFWSPAMNVSRYGVTKWREADFTQTTQ